MPRGVRDTNPIQTITKKSIISVIEEAFKRFGFYPIETPAIENLEMLNAKAYGEENQKEIYTLTGESTGLRFDFTVPLARYIAMNKNVNLPFKRYQIGNVWRKEEPQKMRYREFMQMDADIVGGKEILADSEVIAAAANAMQELQINCTIFINSRLILEAIISHFGIKKDDSTKAIRVIDKIRKLERADIVSQLTQFGIDARLADELMEFISKNDTNEEKLKRISQEIPETASEIGKMSMLLECIRKYEIKLQVKFDPSLARGLDYYTSFVWEFISESENSKVPTLVSGGRYDKLIEAYSGKSIPATGISIGVDRVVDILYNGDKSYFSSNRVYLAYLSQDDYEYSLGVATKLRAEGVYVDMNTTDRNLAKQLEYANALDFSNVIIIGKIEREKKVMKVKNLVSGKEDILSLEEAIKLLKVK